MPTVKVQLENGQFTEFNYPTECTTHQLSAKLCRQLYGEAYEAYKQFGDIAVFEVCQQSVTRRTRSFEKVHDIVSTWPPESQCYLRLEQSPEVLQCDPQNTRLMDVTAMYSLYDQDWTPCTIDIYDRHFHLKGVGGRHCVYNGFWRSLNLQEVDVYESNLPEVVIFRSQVAHEQLPDRVDRMIVIRTTPDLATALKTLVYTIRTQKLTSSYAYTFNSPTIGPPPSVLAPGPPNQRANLASSLLQIPSRAPNHEYGGSTKAVNGAPTQAHTRKSSVNSQEKHALKSLSAPVKVSQQTKPDGPAQESFRTPRLHSPDLLSRPPLLTPPNSPPTSTQCKMEIPLTPPPVPPKDSPRPKSKKRVARQHCAVIDGQAHIKVW